MTELSPFHLAFPVHDLNLAREFYGTVLELPEGRSGRVAGTVAERMSQKMDVQFRVIR